MILSSTISFLRTTTLSCWALSSPRWKRHIQLFTVNQIVQETLNITGIPILLSILSRILSQIKHEREKAKQVIVHCAGSYLLLLYSRLQCSMIIILKESTYFINRKEISRAVCCSCCSGGRNFCVVRRRQPDGIVATSAVLIILCMKALLHQPIHYCLPGIQPR